MVRFMFLKKLHPGLPIRHSLQKKFPSFKRKAYPRNGKDVRRQLSIGFSAPQSLRIRIDTAYGRTTSSICNAKTDDSSRVFGFNDSLEYK
jgi:hypothetical protein